MPSFPRPSRLKEAVAARHRPAPRLSSLLYLPLVASSLLLLLFFFPRPAAPEDRRGPLHGPSTTARANCWAPRSRPRGQWKLPRGAALPEKFERALIAFEDKRFWSHPGFDVRAIARAALQKPERGARGLRGLDAHDAGGPPLPAPEPAQHGAQSSPRPGSPSASNASSEREESSSSTPPRPPFGGNVVGLEAASFRYFGRPPSRPLLVGGPAVPRRPSPTPPRSPIPARTGPPSSRNATALLRILRGPRRTRRGRPRPRPRRAPCPRSPMTCPASRPQLLDRAVAEGRGGLSRRERASTRPLQERVAQIVALRSGKLAGQTGIYKRRLRRGPRRHGRGPSPTWATRASPPDRVDRGPKRRPHPGASELGLHPQALPLRRDARIRGAQPRDARRRRPDANRLLQPPRTRARASPAPCPRPRPSRGRSTSPFVRLLRSYGIERFLRLLSGHRREHPGPRGRRLRPHPHPRGRRGHALGDGGPLRGLGEGRPRACGAPGPRASISTFSYLAGGGGPAEPRQTPSRRARPWLTLDAPPLRPQGPRRRRPGGTTPRRAR